MAVLVRDPKNAAYKFEEATGWKVVGAHLHILDANNKKVASFSHWNAVYDISATKEE